MIKRVEKLEEILDFAWELSKNELYASYPRLKTKEKVKDHIKRALVSDIDRVIACYDQDKLSGLCIYFGKLEEKYVQTTMFLIKGNYDKIADEMIAYIGEEFPGCELLIGLPFSNKIANQYFNKRNIECIDSLIDTRIYDLQPHNNPKTDLLEEITKNNFNKYKNFHDKFAVPLEMYYNSENLKRDLDLFRIYVFKENGQIHASIFVKKVRESAEIFGLFIDEEYKNKGIEQILIDKVLMRLYNEFGSIKEVLYFIEEDSKEELNTALSVGFNIVDTYRCYKYIF